MGFREWVRAPVSQIAIDLFMFGKNYERILRYFDKRVVFLIASSYTNKVERLSALLRFLGLPDERMPPNIPMLGNWNSSLWVCYALGKIRGFFPGEFNCHHHPIKSAKDYAECAQLFRDDVRLFQILIGINMMQASID